MPPSASIRIQESRYGVVFRLPDGLGAGAAAGASCCCAKALVNEKLTISAPDPRNLVNLVLSGVRPVEGERSPIMPGFADSMNDAQIASLLKYLRARFGKRAAWGDLGKIIEDARRTQTVFLQTSSGPYNPPAEASQRDKR